MYSTPFLSSFYNSTQNIILYLETIEETSLLVFKATPLRH